MYHLPMKQMRGAVRPMMNVRAFLTAKIVIHTRRAVFYSINPQFLAS